MTADHNAAGTGHPGPPPPGRRDKVADLIFAVVMLGVALAAALSVMAWVFRLW